MVGRVRITKQRPKGKLPVNTEELSSQASIGSKCLAYGGLQDAQQGVSTKLGTKALRSVHGVPAG